MEGTGVDYGTAHALVSRVLKEVRHKTELGSGGKAKAGALVTPSGVRKASFTYTAYGGVPEDQPPSEG